MKKHYILILFSLLGLIMTPYLLKAQTAPKQGTVKITGEVTNPFELKLADMQQYKQTSVARKDKDGKDHSYSGITLAEILQKAGTTLGKDLKGENLTKFIVVEASDGYRVVFSLAELDKDFTDPTIILATIVDGKPLPPGDGPFRVIVQDDKKPARCIKQVTSIKVQFAK
jgi:DMSO/TMAO reductase YedYZ molybdopterin-dependent catalytic subunit